MMKSIFTRFSTLHSTTRIKSLNNNNNYRFFSTEAQQQQTNITEVPSKRTAPINKLYTLKTISPLQFPIEPVHSNDLIAIKPAGLKHNLPFNVQRTENGKLPVYTEIVRSQRHVYTVLRKYSGDSDVMMKEIKNIFGDSVQIVQTDSNIKIRGKHTKALRVWLSGLGF
ncbi:hypothetical protein CYY_006671 [Polysphondylium violaceum]|uniref:Large ribosomal subunit protein mL49 n=1 Tax=Polysphondylium violaceum TaxID=133409 RepID=A0A8J4PR01_9MYCE|nr:hypothetical protein CYY_006671 [Polysphondylium violaceum]